MDEATKHKERRRNQKLRRKKRIKEKFREERRLTAERRVNRRVEQLIQERLNLSKEPTVQKAESRNFEQSATKRSAQPIGEESLCIKKARVQAHTYKEIDMSHVVRTNQFLGSGTYGSCYLGRYRGLPIVVKELKVRKVGKERKEETEKRLKEELIHEAKAICKLGDHPGLPLLFGISSTNLPFRLIMQFHGKKDGTSLTISKAMANSTISQKSVWEKIIGKAAHALHHIHSVGLIHNDLKANNVVLDEVSDHSYQPIIIDFGKSRPISSPKGSKLLSDEEQRDYRKLYPHIAPEIVKGLHPQSCASDVYSIGVMAKAIYKKYKFGPLPELVGLAIRSSPKERPAIAKIHEFYCNM
jgi:serine/threonine protein kinase